jgi:hypothetical protein
VTRNLLGSGGFLSSAGVQYLRPLHYLEGRQSRR